MNITQPSYANMQRHLFSQIIRRFALISVVFATFLYLSPLHAQTNTSPQSIDSKRWREANTDVGRFQRGHADLLKAERGRTVQDSRARLGAYKEDTTAPELTEQTARKATLMLHADLLSSQAVSGLEKMTRNAQLLARQQATYRLWVEAVSAKEQLIIQRRIMEAASISLELAKRMEKIGNWDRNRVIDIEISYENTRTQLLNADQEAFNSRQQLFAQIGSDHWRLPAALTKPPPLTGLSELLSSPEQQYAELQARHPQLTLIKKEAEYYERIVGPAMLEQWRQQVEALIEPSGTWTHSISTLDRTKIIWNHDLDKAITSRAEISRINIKTKSDLHQAREHLRATHTQATDILDTMQRLYSSAEEEAVMRYSGMFISTWSLIAKAQAKMQTEISVAQGKRAFWIALLDMQAFLAGAPYMGPGKVTGDADTNSLQGKGH